FGSGDSNQITLAIDNLGSNNLYSLEISTSQFREWEVDGTRYPFQINQDNVHLDSGIIARLENPYHKEHYLYVCAGLGEWGTTGAAYYLFRNWEKLYKRFKKNKNFCLVLEVEVGSDQTAREVRAFIPD
ncbi:MAG: hypothetical protein IIC39_06520, partial [Candidatus Marinimicrobia bacterium]|nr:hypothetical protein [Candidatus Neomarinimicrobiota bacterium]